LVIKEGNLSNIQVLFGMNEKLVGQKIALKYYIHHPFFAIFIMQKIDVKGHKS